MSRVELPPLPVAYYVNDDPASTERGLWCERRGPYTEDQMREYGEACARAALSAAIRECDRISGETREFTQERRRGAGQCAAAIRALAVGSGGAK